MLSSNEPTKAPVQQQQTTQKRARSSSPLIKVECVSNDAAKPHQSAMKPVYEIETPEPRLQPQSAVTLNLCVSAPRTAMSTMPPHSSSSLSSSSATGTTDKPIPRAVASTEPTKPAIPVAADKPKPRTLLSSGSSKPETPVVNDKVRPRAMVATKASKPAESAVQVEKCTVYKPTNVRDDGKSCTSTGGAARA